MKSLTDNLNLSLLELLSVLLPGVVSVVLLDTKKDCPNERPETENWQA